MKLIIQDNYTVEGDRYIDVDFEPLEVVAVQLKLIHQKLINSYGLKGSLTILGESGASEELVDYLEEQYFNKKILDAWDVGYYTSTFFRHEKDAQLIMNLKKIEQENDVDLVALLNNTKVL